jgi:ATP-dependent Clp protease ATP-binding subunit ClpC
MSLSDKFTVGYKNALNDAFKLAQENNSQLIEPEYIFYALIIQKGSLGNQIINKLKPSKEELKKDLSITVKKNDKKLPQTLTLKSKAAIKKSTIISNNLNHAFVGTEHLLLALLKINHLNIKKFLKKYKINQAKIEDQISVTLKTISKFSEIPNHKNASSVEDFDFFGQENQAPVDITLEMTSKNFVDKFDPVIGRENEINRIIEILCRRKKNNPLLLGEPGVGKTAIIEGLAKKIHDLDVPSMLFGKKIIKLDLGNAIAGTMFRGEFESRLKNTIEEIQNNPDAILFIDEIHNIVGAGSSNGSLDAANILKPALSRGEFSVIGTTTFADYKKNIEKDRALIRRFENIQVEEPDHNKTLKILTELKEYYEDFHKINISSEAIESAISLSSRYITDKFLPDKAIDLIDEAASRVKIKKQKYNLNFIQSEFDRKLKNIQEEKRFHINAENYKEAIKLRQKEEKIKKEFELFKKFKNQSQKIFLGEIVKKDIIKAVSKVTNIPVEQLNISNKQNIIELEEKLNDKIIGQKEAISVVTKYLKRSLLNMSHPERPLGSFIFLGPTGVGKTELAKEISKTVFGSKKSMIKLDMSEFSDKFNTSKLIGAPAGYVGYDEGGKLTEFVKHNPYSLILFDEIEKAHPDIFNLLLQILEDGILTDASGETINFKNTLIILTSNIGLKDFYFKEDIGFGSKNKKDFDFNELKNKIDAGVKKTLRPELLSRLDKILVFNPLKQKDIEEIVKLQLNELNERLVEKNIKINGNDKAIKHLSKTSYAPDQGARAVRKTIQEKIEDELIEMMIKNKKSGKIKIGSGEITVEDIEYKI